MITFIMVLAALWAQILFWLAVYVLPFVLVGAAIWLIARAMRRSKA